MFALTEASVNATGATHPILRSVSVAASAGEIVLVVGGSGSGKTTLLEAIAALRPLDGGTLSLFGRPVEGTKLPAELRQRVGMLFQDPERLWLRSTVDAELRWPLEAVGDSDLPIAERVQESIRRAGLPDSYLERSLTQLSGGEQRLVAFAATLTWLPDLLLLDEPTAGLSLPWARRLVEQVEELRNSGTTVVIATHDVDHFASAADRVVALERGRIVADGPALDVFGMLRAEGDVSVPTPTLIQALEAFGLRAEPDAELSIDAAAERIASLNWGAPAQRDHDHEFGDSPKPPPSSPPATASPGRRRATLVGIPAGMASAVLIGLAFFVPAPLALLAVLFASLFAFAALNGPGFVPFLRQLRPLFILAAFVSLLHVLTRGDHRLVDLGLIGIHGPGIEAAIRTAFRLVGPVAVGLLVVAQTSTTVVARDLGNMASRLPVVRRLADDLMLAVSIVLRLAPLLQEEARRCDRAQLARGVDAGSGFVRARARRLMRLAVPVAMSTIARANGLAVALYLRGLTDHTALAAGRQEPLFSGRDWLVVAGAAVILASVVLSAILL